MECAAPGTACGPVDHPNECAVAGVDGTMPSADDYTCPHCSAYCAPAAIAMIAAAYGDPSFETRQDYIYENGKHGPFQGDGIIEDHGVGMFHGVGSTHPEVQDAMRYALAQMAITELDISALTWSKLRDGFIRKKRPVLWLDHNGWPSDQNDEYPSEENRKHQGHAKIIAGYDDKNTSESSDDYCLIYDPWPGYELNSALPLNAEKGPADTFDPYWLPVGSVLGDPNDLFIIPDSATP